MLFKSTEVDVELVERGEELAEGGVFGEFREGVHVLREALAAIAELAIWTWDIGVGVVDVAGEEAAGVDLCPVCPHLLAVLADSIKVGDLVGAEDIVRILRDLRFEGRHHRELLAREDRREKREILGRGLGIARNVAGPDHRLLAEVLDVGALGQELRHIADMMPRFLRQHVRGARQNRRANEYRHVGQLADQLLHQRQVLRPVILRRDVNLQERNIHRREIVIVSLRRIGHQNFDICRVILLDPGLERSAHKPAADDANFYFSTHFNSSF